MPEIKIPISFLETKEMTATKIRLKKEYQDMNRKEIRNQIEEEKAIRSFHTRKVAETNKRIYKLSKKLQ